MQGSALYSTRYMRDHFGFKHDIDDCVIKTPSHGIIDITDTRGAFVIPLHLSHDDSPAEGTAAAQQMSSRRADYMSIVGAFLWLANMSRHEISHVSSQLSRFVSNRTVHVVLLERLSR